MPDTPQILTTRSDLVSDLAALGVRDGDTLMVHAALRSLGPVLGGADSVIAALREAVGSAGTLVAYTDWQADYEDLLDESGRVPDKWRGEVPPFDPGTSRAARENGAFPELLRTTPGALRSDNPGASVAAIGAQAGPITRDHPLDYGYGEGSPLARLVACGGKVLMLGAPLDTMTLLHHAEHLAKVDGKPVKRVEVPFASPSGTNWRFVEEFDTCDPILPQFPEDYFATIVQDFMAAGHGARGKVGRADCVLVSAEPIVHFAVDWIEVYASR